MQSLPASVRPSPDVLSRQIDGESVLLHLESGHYFGLDELGTRIWDLLTRHGDPRRVREEICRHYEVSSERAERDLVRFLDQLAAHDLVRLDAP